MGNRVLLGKKGSEYGLWVSKSGVNVTTAGVQDLLFDSSALETMTIYKSGTVSLTMGTTTNTTYYSDYVFYNADESALSYIPLVVIYGTNQCYPIRKAKRIITILGGGRGSNSYYHQLDANLLYPEVLNNKFRIAGKYLGNDGYVSPSGGTYRYSVFAIGGTTIGTAGP